MSSLLNSFSALEKRNLMIYTIGIMLYKFSLETLSGCISQLALSRIPHKPNTTWSTLQAINYATQCIGSLMVAPLIKRYTTGKVLSVSIWAFGGIIASIPLMEGFTQGGLSSSQPGKWNPYILFLIFPLVGIFHGIVELIRRVIPQDIVGGDETKLKRMDSTVHIWYEVAGTSGAVLSRYWIDYFKFAYALAVIPILFSVSGAVWMMLRLEKPGELKQKKIEKATNTSMIADMLSLFRAFFHSISVGAKLVCTQRALVWLIPAYSFPLVLHRYLENVIFPQYAKYVTGRGSYQQILVGGSNLGELLGALFILLFATKVATPLPWLRLDALTLLIIWILPLSTVAPENMEAWVWTLAGVMVFISWGWAAGDVSLVAYVQARLAKVESSDPDTSPLGAVMSFLYVAYIIMFAILSPIMGKVMDTFLGNQKSYPGSAPFAKEAFVYTAGVFLSVSAVIILAATFIPKGSAACNPQVMDDEEDDLLGGRTQGIQKRSDSYKDSVERGFRQEKDGNAKALELAF